MRALSCAIISLAVLPACAGSGWMGPQGDEAPPGPEDVPGIDDPPAATEEEIPGVEDPSATLFGDAIPTFRLTLSADAMAALHESYLDWVNLGIVPQAYVQGAFEYDGQVWDPVGVRLKGQGSMMDVWSKAAFKIKFNEFVPGGRFLGLEALTLNNMRYDYSMMHERLAYRIYREAGVPASRAGHALLYVNGQSYGLYSNVEKVDETMVARWFADAAGPLFEGWDVDFTQEYVPSFLLEYGPDDRTNLEGVAQALQWSGQAALDEAAQHADLDVFRRYWAVGVVVGQFDGYPYTWPGDDFYVYDDPTTGRLWFMPWGVDETFYDPYRDVQAVNGIVAVRCAEVPACRAAWIEQVWSVLDLAESLDWLEAFQAIRDQIAPLVAEDTMKPYTDQDVHYHQGVMHDMIANRAADLEWQLGDP